MLLLWNCGGVHGVAGIKANLLINIFKKLSMRGASELFTKWKN